MIEHLARCAGCGQRAPAERADARASAHFEAWRPPKHWLWVRQVGAGSLEYAFCSAPCVDKREWGRAPVDMGDLGGPRVAPDESLQPRVLPLESNVTVPGPQGANIAATTGDLRRQADSLEKAELLEKARRDLRASGAIE